MLSSSNPTLAEKLAQGEVWARHLFGEIPESRLEECFRYAVLHRQASFAVNALDLLDAWRVLRRADERRSIDDEVTADCCLCFGTGMRFREHPTDPRKSGYARCDHGITAEASGRLN